VLTKVVESALANNIDIAIAAARVEEARAQFSAARGQLLPSVEAAAGARRERVLNAFGQPASQTANAAARQRRPGAAPHVHAEASKHRKVYFMRT
jgi:multidrug efflux system outer membrane protein